MSKLEVCIDCGKDIPLDEVPSYGWGKRGRRCANCRRIKRRERKRKAKAETLDAVEKGAVSTFLKVAAQGGENIPHSAELLERLMEYFGGSSGFSALVVKQYFDSPAGSATRTKLLETLVRLTLKNTELGGAKKPMEQWTDEELEEELNQRLKRVAMQFQGRIIDAPPETPTDFASAFGGQTRLIPEVPTEGHTGGDSKPLDRSAEDVPADARSGGDALVQGE